VAVSERPRAVVSDAGPLIHLDELGCFDLLKAFAAVHVPHAVWDEVARHRPAALRHRTVPLLPRTDVPPVSAEVASIVRSFSLAAGEEEALRLMPLIPGAVFLTDDQAARDAARKLSYEVYGTLGIVLRSLEWKRRTKRQVLNLLRAVPRKSTLFVRASLLDSLIQGVRGIS
jgi:predicted nucleic acid-binding protein